LELVTAVAKVFLVSALITVVGELVFKDKSWKVTDNTASPRLSKEQKTANTAALWKLYKAR
jgi:hypothetical protein